MARNEANVFLAVILSTAAESPDGAPSGVMYAAMMGRIDLPGYQGLLGLAEDAGLVTVESHLVRITAKGRETVAKIEAHVRRSAR